MRIEMLRLGGRMYNKVNAMTYVVTDIIGTGENVTGLLHSIDPETLDQFEPEDPRYNVAKIRKDNAICFRLLYMPEDTVVPAGYKVDGGKLVKNGTPVTEQGQIVIDSIITSLPGYLLLAVKPKDPAAEGVVDVFTFEPDRDRFKKILTQPIPKPEIIKTGEDFVILNFNVSHEEPVLDEDGKETGEKKEVFDYSTIVLVRDKKTSFVNLYRPIESVDKIKGGIDDYLMCSVEEPGEDGVLAKADPYYTRIQVQGEILSELSLPCQPKKPVISASVVKIHEGEMNVLLKGKDFIAYKDLFVESPDIKKTGDYLVDVTYGDHEVTLSLVDEEYYVTTINRKNTRDRGYIVTVTE